MTSRGWITSTMPSWQRHVDKYDSAELPKLVYADVQAYFAACYWYNTLQPLLTRFNRQDLDDLYTQTMLLHYYLTVKTHFDTLWPMRPDLGVSQQYLQSRRTPEIKRFLLRVAERQEYSCYRDLIPRGFDVAKKELILERNYLESLVNEIKATLVGPPSQIDQEIAKLEAEVEETNRENTTSVSE